MKRIAYTSLAILILMSFSVTAYADNTTLSQGQQGQITPLFTYISFLDPRLSINSSGLATCYGSVSLYSSSQTVQLTVALQKSTTNGWAEVIAWTDSAPGVPGVSLERQYYVAKGTYRVCVTARVYNASGTLLETA